MCWTVGADSRANSFLYWQVYAAAACIETDHDIIVLPHGATVVSITPSGMSYWARTAKITTFDNSNGAINYFLKVSPQARDMLR